MYYGVQTLLESKSTAYIQCCPTGYSLASAASPKGFAPTQCTSAIRKKQVISYAYRDQGGFIITSTTNTGTPSVVYAQHVNGYSVATSSSSSAPSSSSTISSSTTALASNNTTTGADAQLKVEDKGLSTGATIGIGIGAALVGVIALVALVWFLVRKRKANLQEEEQQQVFGDQQPVSEKGNDPRRVEIGNGGIVHSHFEPAKNSRAYELQ